jgi:hypothetical protein
VEATADLDVSDAFGDQAQHRSFDRTQEWTRLDHCGDAAGVAAHTPSILVKPIWQLTQ